MPSDEKKYSSKMDTAHFCLETHCGAIQAILFSDRDKLISGNKPPNASYISLNARKEDSRILSDWGKVLKEICRKIVYNRMVTMMSWDTKNMFWETVTPNPLKSAGLNDIFPPGKDEVIQDFLIILKETYYIAYDYKKLSTEDMKHNEDLINRTENQIGWIWLLNRYALNWNLYYIDYDKKIGLDFEKLKKRVNVLGRHVPPEKNYQP